MLSTIGRKNENKEKVADNGRLKKNLAGYLEKILEGAGIEPRNSLSRANSANL